MAWGWSLFTPRGANLHGVKTIYTACGLFTRRWAYLYGVGPATTAWEALPKRERHCHGVGDASGPSLRLGCHHRSVTATWQA